MPAGVDYEARVRRMWDAFEREGMNGMRRYVDEDLELRVADGGVLRGIAAVTRYWESQRSRLRVTPNAWEQHGECVLVHGSMRLFRDGGFIDTQPTWVYFFRAERLVRAASFGSREEALEAIAAYAR